MHDANLTATVRPLPTTSLNDSPLPSVTAQITFVAAQLAFKLLWSDEIKVILGSTMFYPLLTMTAIFLAVRLSPARIIHKCSCYCNRKIKAIWMKVQILLKKIQAQRTILAIRRSHMLGSMKVLVGAAEILMF